MSFIALQTNYHKFNCLKQHLFIISQCLSQKPGCSVAQLAPRFQVSQDKHQNVGKVMFLSGGSGEESASKPIQMAGNINFCTLVGLRSPFPCWFPGNGGKGRGTLSFQRLPSFLGSWPLSSLRSHQRQTEYFTHFKTLRLLLPCISHWLFNLFLNLRAYVITLGHLENPA